MRAVNLLPRDVQRSRLDDQRTPLFAAAGALAAITALGVLLGLSASGKADDRRAELQGIEAAIARLPRASQPVISPGVLTQERSNRVAALSAALSTRVSFDRLLQQVSRVLPEDAWLTSLSATSADSAAAAVPGAPPSPTPSAAAAGVTIQGATFSQTDVARVLSRLSVVPTLEDVRLASAELVDPAPQAAAPGVEPMTTPTNGKKYVTFTITASLRTGASS
jgi:Tfp pilus assembly protein PilN